jgi:EmrB/QacA subfamily drug resistance transporter
MTASTTAPEPTAEQRPLLSHRQVLTIFAGLLAGMFLAALDQTIVATSVRTIADDLNGLSLQASVTTAYLITSTITTPLYGKLSDIFGRKPLFLFAISVFIVGSLACMFAQSMYQLAAFRAVQGIGAGGLFSLALTIIGDLVAPRERARYQGYFVAVFGTSSVLGPLLGGFLAGQDEILGVSGWRWVFGINLPVGLIALLTVVRVLNLPHNRRPHRIDWPGAVALTVGLVPLLLVFEQGRTWGWASPASLACFGVGALGLVAFVAIERRYGDDALLPLRFFRDRVFGLGALAGVIVGMGMFGAVAALPLYLQIVKGLDPTSSGLMTLPLTVGIMSMSITSGRLISRTGRLKVWPVLGVSLMVVGLALLSRIGVDTPFWRVGVCMLVFGWGLGATMQPLTLAVQNAMPPQDMGVATASATFSRQMGGTLGTAVFLSVLFSTVGDRIAAAFRTATGDPATAAALADPALRASPDDARVLDAVATGRVSGISLDDSSFIHRLDPVLARPFLEGFSASMSLVFLVGAAVLLVGLVLVALMPEHPLRQMSGLEAQRAAGRAVPPADPQRMGRTGVPPADPQRMGRTGVPPADPQRMGRTAVPPAGPLAVPPVAEPISRSAAPVPAPPARER